MQVATMSTSMISGPSGAWIVNTPRAENYLKPIYKQGEIILEVECGSNKGLLYLSRLCQGSRGPCIFFDNNFLTPNEFQLVSGRETAKDWKRSIRHCGRSIKLLLSKGLLCVHPTVCNCMGCKTSGQMALVRSTFGRRSNPKSGLEFDDFSQKLVQNRDEANTDSPFNNQYINDKFPDLLNTYNGNRQEECFTDKNGIQRSNKLTKIIEQLRISREKENVSGRKEADAIKTEAECYEEKKVIDYTGKIHFKEIQRSTSMSPGSVHQATTEELYRRAISFQKDGSVSPRSSCSPSSVLPGNSHAAAFSWYPTQPKAMQYQLSPPGNKRSLRDQDTVPLDLTIKKQKTDAPDFSLKYLNSPRNKLDLCVKREIKTNRECSLTEQHCRSDTTLKTQIGNSEVMSPPYDQQSTSILSPESQHNPQLKTYIQPITQSRNHWGIPTDVPMPLVNNDTVSPWTNSQLGTELSISAGSDGHQKCESQLFSVTAFQQALKYDIIQGVPGIGYQKSDKTVDAWSIRDVTSFLQNESIYEKYAKAFTEQHIDGKSLLLLTIDQLVNVVGMKLGPAVRLHSEISKPFGKCDTCQHCLQCHNISA